MKIITAILLFLSFNTAYSQTDSLYGYVDATTFREAEVHPTFAGGQAALDAFLKKEIRRHGTPATVIVEFTVSKAGGAPQNITVYRSDNPELNNEAIRLMKRSKWIPGTEHGKGVNYRVRQEIEFK